MNQFKKAQVIMLPTDKGTIIKRNITNELKFSSLNNPLLWTPQHLYITTDDKIEENDWRMVIDKTSSLYGEFEQHKGSHSRNDQWGKIIATTDRLSIDNTPRNAAGAIIGVEEILPQPSQQFIEQFIEYYNKGEVITDVLVEYEGIEWLDRPLEYFPKINSKDNTITIKKLKDSWSREEVENILYKHTEMMLSGYRDTLDNWIKENL